MLTTHKFLYENNLHVMLKDPVPHLCLPNMGRKALDLWTYVDNQFTEDFYVLLGTKDVFLAWHWGVFFCP